MSVQRRDAMQLEDVRWFDKDASTGMFDGGFVRSFEHPDNGNPVSFLFRRIDPGTLLELTNSALYLMGEEDDTTDTIDPNAQARPVSRSQQLINDLKILKIRTTHRLEILHRCIIRPEFQTLEEVKVIPPEWQVELYGDIMRNVLGGNCLLTGRFQG